MNKVLLVGFTKISYMPYMHFYLEQLKKYNYEIHLLYWDRDGKPDSSVPEGVTGHRFDCYQEDSVPIRKKVFSFLKYRKFTVGVLKEHNFDLLVILHSTPGIVLYDMLMGKYKGKYLLDYLDFTYEDKSYYRKLVHNLVLNSIVTFVSSDAFRKYLPETKKIYTSHNFLLDSLKYGDVRREKPRSLRPIRIRYWGLIRHENINRVIIDRLANDGRFELHYHGREQATGQKLKKYCQDKAVSNVFFHGEYMPVERYSFAAETDLIHNMFENDKTMQPAMSNKFYDGLIFYIPQLCNKGSYMGERVNENDIGLDCDPYNKSFTEDIYNYYIALDWKYFEGNCDKTLNNILEQYDSGVDVLSKIFGNQEDGVNV